MVWKLYQQALMDRPLLVKATTAATLMSVSDVLCQTYEQQQQQQQSCTFDDQDHDWQRTFHVGVTGFSFSGPISHLWYGILERLVAAVSIEDRIGKSHSVLVVNMIIQLFLGRDTFSGDQCWNKVVSEESCSKNGVSALQASWSFWPMANIVNFGLVPLPYRVLYNNGLSLLWNAYLSNLNSHEDRDDVDALKQSGD